MSSKTKEILGRARRMVPPMLDKFHKGEFEYLPSELPSSSGIVQDSGHGTRQSDSDSDRAFYVQGS